MADRLKEIEQEIERLQKESSEIMRHRVSSNILHSDSVHEYKERKWQYVCDGSLYCELSHVPIEWSKGQSLGSGMFYIRRNKSRAYKLAVNNGKGIKLVAVSFQPHDVVLVAEVK